MTFSGPQVIRILMFAALLLAVLLMRRPCSDAVGRFVGSFDDTPKNQDAGVRAIPKPESLVDDKAPPTPDPYGSEYVEIKPGMTDEEIKAVIEKARAKAAEPGKPVPPAQTP